MRSGRVALIRVVNLKERHPRDLVVNRDHDGLLQARSKAGERKAASAAAFVADILLFVAGLLEVLNRPGCREVTNSEGPKSPNGVSLPSNLATIRLCIRESNSTRIFVDSIWTFDAVAGEITAASRRTPPLRIK